MERIRDHWREGMTWRQPRALVPEYELRRGAHQFAELTFSGGWTLQAEARAYDRQWTLAQSGFMGRTIVMTDTRTGRTALTIRRPPLGRSHYTTPGGARHVGIASWTGHRIEDAEGSELVRFERKMRVFRVEADVTITEQAAELPDLHELVVAGWLVAILATPQAASAAVGSGMPPRSA